MQITKTPSSNHDERPNGSIIDTIVLHYTDMASASEAIERLRDPIAKVSAHYLIDETGLIYNLVAEDKRAWHAGESYWAGRPKVNDFSIGIEIANPGHSLGYIPFPAAQMQAVIMLCKDLCLRYPVKPANIVGHSDIAPTRKMDPGELFDWRLLADHGIGIFPDIAEMENNPVILKSGDAGNKVSELQSKLSKYGYLVHMTSTFDDYMVQLVKAFKRHFHQDIIDGVWDQKSDYILDQILQKTAKNMQIPL